MAGSENYGDMRNTTSGCVVLPRSTEGGILQGVRTLSARYGKVGLDDDIVCWIVFTGVPPAGGDRQITKNPSYLYSFSECPGGVQIPQS